MRAQPKSIFKLVARREGDADRSTYNEDRVARIGAIGGVIVVGFCFALAAVITLFTD